MAGLTEQQGIFGWPCSTKSWARLLMAGTLVPDDVDALKIAVLEGPMLFGDMSAWARVFEAPLLVVPPGTELPDWDAVKDAMLTLPTTPDCIDCGCDTAKPWERYMVHDDVWALSGLDPDDGMLCIGCLETRLHRELVGADFKDVLLNTMDNYDRSKRLSERLTR